MAVWVGVVIAICQLAIWAIEQLTYSSSMATNDPRWIIFGVGGVAIWLPLAFLARIGPAEQANLFRGWWLAAMAALWMTPARLLVMTDSQGVALIQCVALGGFLLWARWRVSREETTLRLHPVNGWPVGLALAGGMGALVLLPWVAWGALGSLMDVILGGLTAVLAGLAAALILQGILQPGGRAGQAESGPPGFWTRLGAAPVVLGLLAFGLGVNGNEWLLLLVLPPLGWLAVAFWTRSGAALPVWPAAGLALAVGISGPLVWIDPDELAAVVTSSSGELMEWALRAGVTGVLIGLAVTLLVWAALRRRPAVARGAFMAAGVAAWLGLGLTYALVGRPGFYGEQLFVILKDQPGLTAAAQISAAPLRRAAIYQLLTSASERAQAGLRQDLGRLGMRFRPYYLVDALEVEGGPLVRAWLAERPEVERVLMSPHLRPLPAALPVEQGTDVAPATLPWNLSMVRANSVWDELKVTGKGIVVGQSDSGVDGQHPELASQFRGQNGQNDYAWYDPWNHSAAPVDIGGHGTHTLGTVLGKTVGVAPDAQWIGCVNLARNLGNPALYLDCMQFMLAPFPQQGDPWRDGRPELGANVLNNSWGCPVVEGCDAGTYQVAVRALETAGIFVVASAGNEGQNGCSSLADPLAIYPEVFTVGALDRSGDRADFSNLGPVSLFGKEIIKPDLMAPGVMVLSAFPQNSYAQLSGTSMAGPHVVGAVALMWSANPRLIGNVERTRQILEQSARTYRGAVLPLCGSNGVPNNLSGYGNLDAYAAVQMALAEK